MEFLLRNFVIQLKKCLGGFTICYDWGVFQVLKGYCLKIISTILHLFERLSVLARYSRGEGSKTIPVYRTVGSLLSSCTPCF